MNDLTIPIVQDEFDKPYVNFQAQTGKCEISGESFPEKATDFYERLNAWIEEYIREVKGPLDFDFKLTYFNTSSSKRILHLMMKLYDYAQEGGKVSARWIYHPDDIDLEEDIEDLKLISKLDLEMIPDEELKYRGIDQDQGTT